MKVNFRRPVVAAIHDVIMAGLSFIAALWLRLGDDLSYAQNYIMPGLPIFVLVCFVVFMHFRLYRGAWRYASMQDLLALAKSVSIAIIIFVPIMFVVNRLDGMPRSIPIINWFVLIGFLGGPRFVYRIIKDKTLTPDLYDLPAQQKISLLLIGMDEDTEYFIRSIINKPHSQYRIAGIVSNDQGLIGRQVHAIRVYGPLDDVEQVIEKLKRKRTPAKKMVLSRNITNPDVMKKLMHACETYGLTVGRIPEVRSVDETVSNDSSITPIHVEDLLTRPQIQLQREMVEGFLKNKVVAVTGAGGSIGSEICRQVIKYSPKKLLLLEHNETQLYTIDQNLNNLGFSKHIPLVADVCDTASIKALLKDHKVDCVFHAAALKHVPLSEQNILPAVHTNIMGTKSVADCCHALQIPNMVLISTDKAVNPTNIMGATKRLAELYVSAMGETAKNQTVFSVVRFGNVLGSSGSVIPLFQKQIAAGGPITITHPEITRFFMTIREAVELVLQASTLSDDKKHSRLYVLNMGEPLNITDLAKQLITLSGLKPVDDIEITYTGLRPGEKIHEELLYEQEKPVDEAHPNVWLAKQRVPSKRDMEKVITQLQKALKSRDEVQARAILFDTVSRFAE